MRQIAFAVAAIVVASLSVPTATSGPSAPRQLTFEDRVRAQEAIERVYYSHQIGATMPFAQAVSREVLEKKVRTYLRQSAALERYWDTPITAEALRAELMRITGRTRFPARLRELDTALGHDPLLMQECLARPLLADRLARRFFSHDARIHAETRRQAESLRERLVTGELGADDEHPSRHVADITREEENFVKVRNELPERTGEAGALREDAECFSTSVLLEEDAERIRVARFAVSKLSWDDWWRGVECEFDPAAVETVAEADLHLPEPVSVPGQSVPCAADDSWDLTLSHSSIPDGRTGHTGVWTGSEMIIWGGGRVIWGGGSPVQLNSGFKYDPLTDAWASITSTNAPPGLTSHTAVWTGSRMIVWGSVYGLGSNAGGIYDPVGDTWLSTSTVNAPAGGRYHTAVWTGTEMIVWGGGTALVTAQNSGGRYDPETDTWKATASLGAPDPRASHTAVWTGTEMIVWGGFDPTGDGCLTSGGRYDPARDQWEPTPTTDAPSVRCSHSAVWTGNELVVWGGEVPGTYPKQYLRSGARYDPKRDRWKSTSTDGAASPRSSHEAVWTGTEVIVWGGKGATGYLGTGGRYAPALNRWKPVAVSNAPSPRHRHSAVWTGRLMIVWSGYSGVTLDSGARYDPASNSWTPMVDYPSPSVRNQHTAVWTGNQMIIWGGQTEGTMLNTGGRYDPTTDSWSATSRTGAPSPRLWFSTVWTGTYMVIWGGDQGGLGNSLTADGGRYDPVADAWLPVTTVGSPGPRRSHKAIWTGSEMIEWGGDGYDSPALIGGRYNPTADTWALVSTIGAPTERSGHSVVWTGTHMIVWGGWGTGGWEGTGGRYDPVTDLWTATSTVGAPSGREPGVALWTGTEMFIWGGFAPGPKYLQTGGLYDPVADTWRPTSLIDAPAARAYHTALWTGHVAIVWGGYLGEQAAFTNTGGRYDPASDSWSDTSTTDAPAVGAGDASAVWTGSSMLLWSGTVDRNVHSYLLEQSVDDDGDGASECDGDCNDRNPGVLPGIAETCDGLDNDCDGQVDEDVAGAPPELCDGLDNDCDDQVDEGGACDPAITSPMNGQTLDCSPGATPPAITWEPGRFDGFRVYVAWDRSFSTTTRVTSGASLVRTRYTWTPSRKQWKKACANARPDLHIRVEGFDSTLPKGDPLKRVLSDIVSVPLVGIPASRHALRTQGESP